MEPTTTNKQWLGHPRPIEGETFSSWFRRVAGANAMTARELYRVALPGSQLYSYDLDRHACDGLSAALAQGTGVAADAMRAHMLDRWDGAVVELRSSSHKLPWLPPAGREASTRSFGQQACSTCLAEDAIPHMRAAWRLAFVTICERHGSLLIDRCLACGEPIQVLWSERIHDAIVCCWKCDRDLRDLPPEAPQSPAIQHVQAELMGHVAAGWTNLGRYGAVHTVPFFLLLNQVFRLLLTGRQAHALREWTLQHHGQEIQAPPESIPRMKEAERLNPRARGILVCLAWELAQEWPDRFVEACRATGIRSRVLLKDTGALPYAYWHAVSAHLSDATDTAGPEEVAAAKALLLERGVTPTRSALRELLGKKFEANAHLAAPGRICIPYGTHRYWKLDGVSPEVRAAAKTAARRQGENVGAWVDKTLRRVLTDDSRYAYTK